MSTEPPAKWRLIVVPHTHWDREWYFPFQRYRTRLVGFFDLLLDILESDPEYKHFMLDGHTILVEDYLEVRPDRREQVERLIREGRLSGGPWYVIPDESLPSGEGLVRNLLRGHRTARELGSVMQVGYLPDPFGQIAHMPAILNGFGIKRCVFWRGTDASLDTSEFLWQGADGSEVFVCHMAGGYGIAAPFPVEEEAFIERIEAVRSLLQPLARGNTLLLMWGSDHVPPQRQLPGLIAAANARIPDAELVHGSLPQLFDELERQLDGKRSLPARRGEFRSGQRSHLLPGVLSARVWIKQRTFECERMLTRWAEPLTLWSQLLRRGLGEAWSEPPPPTGPASPFPKEAISETGLLDRAWRLLLENQPHDSICGCSVDQTHDEMRPRFDQCEQIGDDLSYEAMRRIGAQAAGEQVMVFNTLPGARTDYAKAVVPARRGAQPVALVDDKGGRWPCQAIASADPRPGRVTVGFVAGDVPGFGYRSYGVEYGEALRQGGTKHQTRIENEFFRVDVSPRDGTLTVLDKRSKRRYAGLNRLVDGGDRGDEYNYCVPEPDVVVDRPSGAPRARLIEDSLARQTLEVRMTYRLPARLTSGRKRSTRLVICPVRVLVSVSPGVPRIDVRTEVDNRAEDHRLRAHFPSGAVSDVSHAEQHFGVVSRPVALPEWDDTWMEQPVGTHPQKTFCDVNDGERGLMIANRGLQEYEALETRGGLTIALTLLRCVGWLSRGDLSSRKGHAGPALETPGAQCPGPNVFEYAIVPHDGGWENAYVEAHRFAAPVRARWNPNGTGMLSATASMLDIEGEGVTVSALKLSEDHEGTVVRLYNTLDRKTSARVRLHEAWGSVRRVDMKEDLIDEPDVSDKGIRLALKPNEIVTLKFGQALGSSD